MFLIVKRLGTVTGAARHLGVAPSQVSKAIARLEGQLQLTLLARSSRGVTLSDAGRRILPQLEEVVSRLELLGNAEQVTLPVLTMAAPSYMNATFLPPIATSLPGLRVRGLDLPQALVRAHASENFFDLTILSGMDRLPSAWVSSLVGMSRLALFASRALARRLGRSVVGVDKLREVPFISPVYNSNGQFVPVDDDCPLRFGDRRMGHEVQTIGLALELAVHTDQLVFGPAFAARHHLRRGALVEVKVRGWSVKQPLYVLCNSDRVLSRVQGSILRTLQRTLEECG